MAKSLVELYEENYLGVIPQHSELVQEESKKSNPFAKGEDEDEDEDTAPKKKKSSRNKGGFKPEMHTDQTNTFNKLYSTFMEQFEDDMEYDEEGGDDTFDFEDGGEEDFGGDSVTFTLDRATAQTLIDVLQDALGGDEGYDDMEDDGFDDEEDDIRLESYGQDGGGAHHGGNGNYSGKAGRQSPTTHVKGNGDADFGKQDTGYDPEDTEGSEGSEHGAQGDYSGKAKRQAPTSHVKPNGDANFGKQNTGYRTRTGKKEKNYF